MLLKNGATLERGFQAVLDARPRRDLWVEADLREETRQRWMALFVGSPRELQHVARVPEESCEMPRQIFGPMAQCIEHLHRRVAG